jgi:hypothetical protein
LFGREVPTDQFVEQFVAFHGVLGRVDVYQETPTDIRTTASMPGDVLAERRDYVDQLGMYCAMTGVPRGRLIVYRRATGERAAALKVFDVRYRDLGAIEGAMIASRDTLCGAIDGADPTALPRCDRTADGCEYRGQCGCDAARAAERVVAPDAVRLKENTELAAMLGAHAVQHALAAPRVPRIGDLVSVQAAGADASDDDETDVSTIEGRLAELERQGFWGALTRAMHFGVPGAFTRQYVERCRSTRWV